MICAFFHPSTLVISEEYLKKLCFNTSSLIFDLQKSGISPELCEICKMVIYVANDVNLSLLNINYVCQGKSQVLFLKFHCDLHPTLDNIYLFTLKCIFPEKTSSLTA